MGWMLVTTTRPRLAVSPRIDSIIDPWPMPMAQMTLSHMRPQVSRWMSSNASSTDGGGVGGAEGGGELALQLDRVDGEDHLGAGETGALHGRGADAADADHRDVIARPHVGGVDGRAPAGRDAAPDEAGLVERDVVEDLHARRLVDHRVRGEGAEADHGRDVLATGVVPDGAVHLPSRHQDATDVAQVGVPGRARGTLATGRHEAEHHVVAGLELGHTGPDLLDDAGALVAADHRERARACRR